MSYTLKKNHPLRYLAQKYLVKALQLAKVSKDSVLYRSMIEPKLKRIEQMNYGKQ